MRAGVRYWQISVSPRKGRWIEIKRRHKSDEDSGFLPVRGDGLKLFMNRVLFGTKKFLPVRGDGLKFYRLHQKSHEKSFLPVRGDGLKLNLLNHQKILKVSPRKGRWIEIREAQ